MLLAPLGVMSETYVRGGLRSVKRWLALVPSPPPRISGRPLSPWVATTTLAFSVTVGRTYDCLEPALEDQRREPIRMLGVVEHEDLVAEQRAQLRRACRGARSAGRSRAR